MNSQQQNEDGRLPEALRYDETTLEYINAEKNTDEEEALPIPPPDHIEVLADGEEYLVHDPARDTFDLDHSAPLQNPAQQQIEESAEGKLTTSQALLSERQAPVDEAMRPAEETQTAAEMIQDDWIDEQDMLDMAQIEEVLDPVETE